MNGSRVIRSKRWLSRHIVAGTTILTGFVCSILAFAMVSDWEQQMLKVSFELAAKSRIETIRREIDANLHTVSSLRSLYDSTESVDRSRFKIFAESLLQLHPSVRAVEWIPCVKHAERVEFEASAKVDGITGFHIWERDRQENIRSAAERPEYFPICYVEPHRENEIALGFDIASNPARRDALEEARDRGTMVATGRVALVHETSGQYGSLVFVPVYRRDVALDSESARRDALRGFVLGVFETGTMVERSLASLAPEAMELAVYGKKGRPCPRCGRLLSAVTLGGRTSVYCSGCQH